MINIENKRVLLFLLLLIFILGANFVLAAKELEIDYPSVPGAEIPTTIETILPEYIKYIFNLSLIVAALAAVIIFIYGGVRYLTSVGNPSAQKDARSWISAAVLGLIILFSSYVILTTVNPHLVILKAPALEKVSAPSPAVPLATEVPLTAQEIPLGAILETRVFEKTRLNEILRLVSEEILATSEEIQGVSDEIKKLSEDIKDLTDQCACEECLAISNLGCSRETKWCGGDIISGRLVKRKGCGGYVYKESWYLYYYARWIPVPSGTPCYPCKEVEGAIMMNRTFLQNEVLKLAELKTKLEELVAEVQILKEGLQKDAQKLTQAKEEIENCYFLMSYAVFDDIRSNSERKVVIEPFCEDFNEESDTCDQEIITEPDDATFYCETI